jgi:hypothetical protein
MELVDTQIPSHISIVFAKKKIDLPINRAVTKSHTIMVMTH